MSSKTEHSDHVEISRSDGRLELKMLSDPATLRPVRVAGEEFCREAGLAAKQVEEVGLVLNEALANVMRHQYKGATDRPIQVTFTKEGERVKINIRDWGEPFDPGKKLPKREPPDDVEHLTPGGLGLICMRKLMDEVEFVPQKDGMLLTMVKNIGSLRK
jgi:serine/threonine-protein kinase RsbW